jgi:sec-independent protein translocase protein TatC
MRKFFRSIWLILTFPFRAIWWIINLPVRAFRSIRAFLTTEPEEHPLGEVISDLVRDEQARSMFWEQVEIFRAHLLRAMIAIAIGVGITLYFTPKIVDFLAIPIHGIGTLRAIEVTESFSVYMKVTLLGGVAIALPYVVFELWLFIAPGLKPRERMFSLIGIPLATIFFLSGMAFTYFILLPAALPFLLNMLGIQAQLRPDSYFSFVTGLMFWIGVIFEYPLVVYILTAMGLVKPQSLARNWRIAMIIIAIIAALGPTVDALSMILSMLPMIVLYFVGVALSFVAYRERKRSVEPKPAQESAE